MSTGLTPSEQFVTALCQESFLRLWTHPNPKGKKSKELCDYLIVCGPHIVIISVKENEYRDTGNETGWERWMKAALEKSFSQIRGAERWLETVEQVERSDGRFVSLPERTIRKYYRISVSLGGQGKVPIEWGDVGSGFIHVCNEYSVGALFQFLDTITDFVDFLRASEELARSGVLLLFSGGGIEDLIAFYVLQGRSLDLKSSVGDQPNVFILHDDLWRGFIESEDFKVMQEELRESYVWDNLIEYYTNDLLTDGMIDMHSGQVTNNELAFVTMALQPRTYRAGRCILTRVS